MLAPHLAAVYLAWRGRAFWSGVRRRNRIRHQFEGTVRARRVRAVELSVAAALAAGFAIPNLAICGWLWSQRALRRLLRAGVEVGPCLCGSDLRRASGSQCDRADSAAGSDFMRRSGDPAIWYFEAEQDRERWKWAAWLMISFIAVAAGWRFFPRYFFQILPVVRVC